MERKVFYHKAGASFSAEEFAGQLKSFIDETLVVSGKEKVLFLCIGSDRSTGDSLGPLVGHALKKGSLGNVLGTLSSPVHAMNLDSTLEYINDFFSDCIVIAIDASVGQPAHVGYITIGRGSIKPGLGVSKNLREVGDIFITGIVGSGYGDEPFLLQSTRLKIVVELAESICEGIDYARCMGRLCI
ncbi:MAG: spore protease YyaC [Lachnospiraceae bacterium]|nr:spore protease YyaC [Lachnospiraceae bacterium]